MTDDYPELAAETPYTGLYTYTDIYNIYRQSSEAHRLPAIHPIACPPPHPSIYFPGAEAEDREAVQADARPSTPSLPSLIHLPVHKFRLFGGLDLLPWDGREGAIVVRKWQPDAWPILAIPGPL